MQVRYVNKALQRFDSTQVIPIQFVMFTLCVIIGSAVLYRDFERTTTEQAIKFVGGCLLTFFGVFLITSGRNRRDDEETLSEVSGVEETIGLHEQGPNQQVPHAGSARTSVSSRRSSRASRVSFVDALTRPVSLQRDSGVPSLRIPAATPSKSPLDSAPLLTNPWQEGPEEPEEQVGLRSTSNESVASVAVVTPVPEALSPPPLNSVPIPPTHATDASLTPRASVSARPNSRHYPDLLISPSPLSSTVSAVVKDTFRRHADSPLLHKSSLGRIRSSIRASLFMSDDDDDNDMPENDEVDLPPRLSYDAPENLGSTTPAASDTDSAGTNSMRRRARSLSHTLGELFKRKKKKENATDVEDGDDDVRGPSEPV
jgi:magnesium transporter